MLCQVCGGVMRPLFTGSFCPNDCDRPSTPSHELAPHVAQYDGMMLIARKVLSADRQRFLDGARGRAAPWYALRIRGTWRAANTCSTNDSYQAEIILLLRESGDVSVIKNRFGGCVIADIPDQP